jgi:hypothetical protein
MTRFELFYLLPTRDQDELKEQLDALNNSQSLEDIYESLSPHMVNAESMFKHFSVLDNREKLRVLLKDWQKILHIARRNQKYPNAVHLNLSKYAFMITNLFGKELLDYISDCIRDENWIDLFHSSQILSLTTKSDLLFSLREVISILSTDGKSIRFLVSMLDSLIVILANLFRDELEQGESFASTFVTDLRASWLKYMNKNLGCVSNIEDTVLDFM